MQSFNVKTSLYSLADWFVPFMVAYSVETGLVVYSFSEARQIKYHISDLL